MVTSLFLKKLFKRARISVLNTAETCPAFRSTKSSAAPGPFRVTPRRVWGALGEQHLSPAGLSGGTSLGGGLDKLRAHRYRSVPSWGATGGRSHGHLGAEQRACAAPPKYQTNKNARPGGVGGFPVAAGTGSSPDLTGSSLCTRAAAREVWLRHAAPAALRDPSRIPRGGSGFIPAIRATAATEVRRDRKLRASFAPSAELWAGDVRSVPFACLSASPH